MDAFYSCMCATLLIAILIGRPAKGNQGTARKTPPPKAPSPRQETTTPPRQENKVPTPERGTTLWPTMIKEVITEVLPGEGVVLEELSNCTPLDHDSPDLKAEVHRLQVQQEAVERTITVSTTKGGTCRGRRKVTVDVSMTVAKRFVF